MFVSAPNNRQQRTNYWNSMRFVRGMIGLLLMNTMKQLVAPGVNNRKELDKMLRSSRKKFQKVVVWSVDRVGRSMKHLVSVLSQLKDLDIDIYS